jgi:hypothetical protein
MARVIMVSSWTVMIRGAGVLPKSRKDRSLSSGFIPSVLAPTIRPDPVRS